MSLSSAPEATVFSKGYSRTITKSICGISNSLHLLNITSLSYIYSAISPKVFGMSTAWMEYVKRRLSTAAGIKIHGSSRIQTTLKRQ
jgi:hypothetical protein